MINHRKTRQGQVQKSKMAVCRRQFWGVILLLFMVWSVLICMNYSSLINSVASLARFYVYYVEPVQIITNPNFTTGSGSGSGSAVENDYVSNVRKIEEKTEENDSKDDDEIDKLLDVNIHELIEKSVNDQDRQENHDQPSDEEKIKPKAVPNEITRQPQRKQQQTNSFQKKRRKRGKPKKKKTKIIIPNIQQVTNFDSNSNQELTWNNKPVEENVTLSPPPPPPSPVSSPPPPPPPPNPLKKCISERYEENQSCEGRYIYIQTLPRRFNMDLVRDCKSLDLWMDMCQYTKNSGLGPSVTNSDGVFSEYGWFATNQFLLEVIFHNRMKQYECLTNDSSKASAVFVPFYAGLDVARHLWNTDSNIRDSSGFEVVKLLKRKVEWKKWWGRDHFFVGGRITWDFRRSANTKDPDWGTKFLYLDEVRNMTGLVIESSPWNSNDFGIPYPTYFHPANDEQVFEWQSRMRTKKRGNLFCFAGAPRPDRPDSIRNQLIKQCEKSRKCMMIHCNNWKNKCHKPAELMKTFQSSDFCLQPPGDSYTRRSTFDSIIGGCIPVFFHPGSAYIQYLWHFPKEFTKYSVFISMYDIRDGKVSIESVLEKIPRNTVVKMREEIIKMIPKIVYADPRCRLETLEDAFDLTIKGVLDRVTRIKMDMRGGKDDSFGYDERQAWKFRWLGKLMEHEWDPYFSGSFDTRNFTNF